MSTRKIATTMQPMAAIAVLAVSLLLPPLYAQSGKLELKNLEALRSKASDVTDVSLDGAMLGMAAQADKSPASGTGDFLKKLKGVYVKSFKFNDEGGYSTADVDSIRTQLQAPNWTRVIETTENHGHHVTSIYVTKQGDAIVGLAILVAEPRELTVVNIVGPIDFQKLGAMGGQLGLPSMGAVPSKPPGPSEPPALPAGPKSQNAPPALPATPDSVRSGTPIAGGSNPKPAGRTVVPSPAKQRD
ncbi:MAG: hypothetical protein NVS9B4_13680 [Candidatus Acidiferrum sp.]